MAGSRHAETNKGFSALEQRHVTQSTGARESLDIPRQIAPGGFGLLLVLVDAVAAILLATDLIVVSLSVYYRYVLAAPIEWTDDVARGLMVAMSFFGAASALARNENAGVAFFVQKLQPRGSGGESTLSRR